MEKYDAIFRTINDRIAELEDIIKMYRKETAEKDATIRKLEANVSQAEQYLNNAKARLDELENSYEKKLDEISELKAANAKLTAKINEFEKF